MKLHVVNKAFNEEHLNISVSDYAAKDSALRQMSLDCIDKSTLVQVMVWCHKATSHYLSQC